MRWRMPFRSDPRDCPMRAQERRNEAESGTKPARLPEEPSQRQCRGTRYAFGTRQDHRSSRRPPHPRKAAADRHDPAEARRNHRCRVSAGAQIRAWSQPHLGRPPLSYRDRARGADHLFLRARGLAMTVDAPRKRTAPLRVLGTRGSAVVEFAFVAPVLLLVLTGILQFG